MTDGRFRNRAGKFALRADFATRSLNYFLVFTLFRQIMFIKDKR